MSFHHFSHHALLTDDELLHRNDSFMRVLNIIQNLSYCSDKCNSCFYNMLFMKMLNAYLFDFLSLLLDWSRQVEYLSSSWVLDSKSIKLNWIFFEKVSSRIEKLNSRTQVELKSWTRQLDSITRLNSTRSR